MCDKRASLTFEDWCREYIKVPVRPNTAQQFMIDGIKAALASGQLVCPIVTTSSRASEGAMWNRHLWDLATIRSALGKPTYVA